MNIVINGSIETGFETTIKMMRGEAVPIELNFEDKEIPFEDLYLRINATGEPVELNYKNGGIERKNGSTVNINLSALPEGFPPGLYGFDLTGTSSGLKMVLLSGYIDIGVAK